jgi:hypothetical protein
MKALVAALTVFASLLMVTLLVVAAIAWSEHRRLTASNLSLQSQLTRACETLSASTTNSQAFSNRLASLEVSNARMEEQLEAYRAAAKAAEDSLPRPYRVRAFVGTDSLGEAWMSPQNITRDPDNGRYRFEPVLVLDASSRERLTVHHTNTVQTEIVSTEYVPYYYGYPYYWGGGRPPLHGGTNLPPVNPKPPIGSPAPLPSVPDYGDVSLRAQLFAPPLSTVNSRPQVLGRPATSPINAQVFAP